MVNSQQQEIDQVSTTVSDMSHRIQEVADNILRMAQSVKSINAESEATADVSRTARSQLDLMVVDVSEAVGVVTELNNHSKEIARW